MIAIIPALAIALIAAVIILVPLPTWAILALVIAGVLVFLATQPAGRFHRGGV